MEPRKIITLILAVAVCMSAGVIGSLFTAPAISGWYATLNRPDFSPPNWVFAPVWTTLYILMGISLYLIWEKRKNKHAKPALAVFSVQLVLNTAWSFLFFGLQSPFYGLLDIIPLWFFIAATIHYSYKISKKAAYLLIPYLLWVSFAAILNFSIYLLN